MEDTVNNESLSQAVINAEKTTKAEEVKTSQNTTTVQLPSNGLINPNIKEVTLRRMTVKESKTLFSSNDPNYLATLIVGAIIEPINITTKDLHPNDIIYLSFILRYISSPKALEQKAVCRNRDCNKVFTHKVDIPSLPVKYATPSEYNFTVKLPDNGDLIKFKIMSEFDATNCDKIASRKARQYDIDDVKWFTLLSKTAYIITEINNEPKEDMEEKSKYIEELSALDFESISKAYYDITSSFGLERDFYTECPHCHEDVEVEAYIAPDFFQLV